MPSEQEVDSIPEPAKGNSIENLPLNMVSNISTIATTEMPVERKRYEASEPAEGNSENSSSRTNFNAVSLAVTAGSEIMHTFQRPVQHSQLCSNDSTSELQQGLIQQQISIDNLAMNHHALYLKALKFRQINAELYNKDIWKEFSKHGTEMVVTKKGRRMFPTIKASVYNLEPNTYYFVILDFIRADEQRYKYIQGQWVNAGNSYPQLSNRIYLHPKSPASGAKWMEEPISFNKVKLTNNIHDTEESIILTSMHKYLARVHIVEGSDITLLPWGRFAIFPLQETSFIAVTAYQNPSVVNLKIENNPFARAFLRSQRSEKRFLKMNETSDESSPPLFSIGAETKKRIKVAEDNSTNTSRQATDVSKMIKPGLTSMTALPLDMPLSIDTTLSNSLWSRDNISLQYNGQLPLPQDYNYLQSIYSMNNSGLPVLPSTYDRILPFHPDYYYNSKYLLIADAPYRCIERYCNNPSCIAFGRPVDQFNSPSEMCNTQIRFNPLYNHEGTHNVLQNEAITRNNS